MPKFPRPFYGNPRVTAAALHLGVAADTARRGLEQDVLLVVQDTTTLNFTGWRWIAELGPIDSGGRAHGVHLHTALAVTASGQVVGILDQQARARPLPGQPGPEEKESGQGIHGLEAARAALDEAAGDRPLPRLIHVMDREGDAYEVMMAVVDAGDSAILRCAGPPGRRPVGSGRTRRCGAGRCWVGRRWRWAAPRASPGAGRRWNCGRYG